jgi:four helix bundle protein
MGAWRHGGMEAWGHWRLEGLKNFVEVSGIFFVFPDKPKKNMVDFRFQDLVIWKDSVIVSKELFLIANKLKQEKYHSFSDQLFRAALSITNNIAEGSGSASKKDFANYLIISRKSVFECANIIIILHEYGLIEKDERDRLSRSLMELSKKIYFFRKTLLSD